jgi:hypothetical protein
MAQDDLAWSEDKLCPCMTDVVSDNRRISYTLQVISFNWFYRGHCFTICSIMSTWWLAPACCIQVTREFVSELWWWLSNSRLFEHINFGTWWVVGLRGYSDVQSVRELSSIFQIIHTKKSFYFVKDRGNETGVHDNIYNTTTIKLSSHNCSLNDKNNIQCPAYQ